MQRRILFHAALAALLLSFAPRPGLAADWPMFGGDRQRTGWAREESRISRENAKSISLLWKVHVKNETKALAALTAPIVMTGIATKDGPKDIVYVGGTNNVFYALDAKSGVTIWEKEFKSVIRPVRDSFWLCPNGLNATPAADRRRGVVYVISNDGKLYSLDLATGEEKFRALQVVPAYAKAWSLNLWEDKIYTSISQNCGETPSGVVSIDVSDPRNFTIRNFRTAKFAAGVWGRGGPIFGNDDLLYAATGDGDYNPEEGNYGESILALNPDTLALVDYFTPSNWEKVHNRDFDIGTSPVAFTYEGKELIAVGGKEGLVYLVQGAKGARVGGPSHHEALYTTPLLANEDEWFEGRGVWGGLSYRLDEQGRHWVYVPLWGPAAPSGPKYPITNGPNPDGSIAAFTVEPNPQTGKPYLKPQWISDNFSVPEPAIVANDVVFALSNGEDTRQSAKGGVFDRAELRASGGLLSADVRKSNERKARLRALDASTGKLLYESKPGEFDAWTHFSGIAISDGRVFAVDFSNTVHCFGLSGN